MIVFVRVFPLKTFVRLKINSLNFDFTSSLLFLKYQIIYNNDGPFDRAAEWYIVNHSLLRNAQLKSQSRLYVNPLIREGLIKLRRVDLVGLLLAEL